MEGISDFNPWELYLEAHRQAIDFELDQVPIDLGVTTVEDLLKRVALAINVICLGQEEAQHSGEFLGLRLDNAAYHARMLGVSKDDFAKVTEYVFAFAESRGWDLSHYDLTEPSCAQVLDSKQEREGGSAMVTLNEF